MDRIQERPPMQIERTERGFAIARFKDRYDIECNIQESSLATEACLWLGTKKDRMHVTQELAAELIPMLQHFVDHGTLPYSPE
jgi:hypothetical protein